MIPRVTQTLAVAVTMLAAGAGALGCDPAEPAKNASTLGLPRWEGHARDVFDDIIDPAAVGLSLDGPSPRQDRNLRERSQTADVVARVRIQTVTVDSIGDQQTYHIGIQVGVPTLTEAKVPDRSFELSIKANNNSFGIARSFDARLRGKTFVGFVKRFGGEDGEQSVHWHLAPDTAEVVSAVKEAVVLREISGS